MCRLLWLGLLFMTPEPRTLMDLYETGELGEVGSLEIDWGEGADEVIEPSCDLENPESCESCQ